MTKRNPHDPSTWSRATAEELKAMFAEASPQEMQALLDWAVVNWILEPGRFPDTKRFRDPRVPSSQFALMSGLDDFRPGPLGTSSLSTIRQQVLLAAAERASLWELRFGTREEVTAAIEWAIGAGWVKLAAERGEAGLRSGSWTELPSHLAARAVREPENWSAGPYPMERDFTEVLILLTPSGQEAVASGVADDAIRASFSAGD